MKVVTLANGLRSSRLGFGCMSLSPGLYKRDADFDETKAIELVKATIDAGINHFDTAIVYGLGISESILGKAIKGHKREDLLIATKTGIKVENMQPVTCGDPAFIRQTCLECLERLQTDYIDLFYLHRIDPEIPIETSMGELKKLVEEGKIKYIGLSEATEETIRKAHAVHPLGAVQYEYSLWTRNVEDRILPTCRELGIALVCYSPLGRGMFAGAIKSVKDLEGDWRANNPRFTEENFAKNLKFFEAVEKMATAKGCSPAQLSLAWLLAQGDDIIPIPGTSKIANMQNNCGATKIELTPEEAKTLADLVPLDEVAGERYDAKTMTRSHEATKDKAL